MFELKPQITFDLARWVDKYEREFNKYVKEGFENTKSASKTEPYPALACSLSFRQNLIFLPARSLKTIHNAGDPASP